MIGKSRLILKFGVIIDTHYGYDPEASYPARVAQAVSEIDAAGCSFVWFGGDIVHGDIDDHDEAYCATQMAAFQSDLTGLVATPYYSIGNHEHVTGYTPAQDIAWWKTATGMAAEYYTFTVSGVTFVVIMDDTNHEADATQLAWITSTLAAAAYPVIVLTHETLTMLTARTAGYPSPTSVPSPNAAAILAAIEASCKVRAVISGHYHVGAQEKVNGIWHYACRSLWSNTTYPLWDNPTPDAYRGIVEVYGNGIRIDERVEVNGLR